LLPGHRIRGQRLKAAAPGAQLALLGTYEGDTQRARAAAGAGTYVPKSMLATDLIPTLEALLNWSEGRSCKDHKPGSSALVGMHSSIRVRFPGLDVTMAPQEPQPRVEGVSLSGAMARQGGSLHHGQRRSTSHRRILYDTEARGSQRDVV